MFIPGHFKTAPACEQLIRQAVTVAKKGNRCAPRWCLERVLATRKERSIELELPPAQNAQDLAANTQRIVTPAGEGGITPGEAQALTEVPSIQAHLCETADRERRVQVLEEYRWDVGSRPVGAALTPRAVRHTERVRSSQHQDQIHGDATGREAV